MMLLGGPQPKQRPEALEERGGFPPFSDPRIQRPSLPMSGWGGPPPPLHLPPLNPHLNCEGIWICNIGLQKGRGGVGGWILQWPLYLEE